MGEIQVTSATLRSKAGELEGLNAKFKTAVDELKSVEGTLRSEFIGDASDAFHTKFTTNSAKWDLFYAAISQYVQKLNEIASTYEAAEQAATTIANS